MVKEEIHEYNIYKWGLTIQKEWELKYSEVKLLFTKKNEDSN